MPNGDSNGGIKATEDPVKKEPEGNVTSISVSEGPQVSKVLLGGEDDKPGEKTEVKEEVKLIQKKGCHHAWKVRHWQAALSIYLCLPIYQRLSIYVDPSLCLSIYLCLYI